VKPNKNKLKRNKQVAKPNKLMAKPIKVVAKPNKSLMKRNKPITNSSAAKTKPNEPLLLVVRGYYFGINWVKPNKK
jgi:hypothetical protein